MEDTPLSFDVKLRPEGVLIDGGSLFAALAGLHDRQDARGLRHALVTVLLFIVLANVRRGSSVRDRRLGQVAEGT